MLISTLFNSPQMFLIVILAIIYALTVHEFSHALAATYLGDNTAKYAGRLTFNPVAHLDVYGTLMLLLAGFGWGKPVPVNPYNLRWRKWGDALVSLAGPLSNFISVVVFIIIANILAGHLAGDNLLFSFLVYLVFINLILGVFNLIPIPPLDGSHVLFSLLPARWDDFKRKLSLNGPWILFALIILDNFGPIHVFSRIFNWFITLISRFV